jgi:mannose-6-phosphate isomerase class I
MYMGLDQETARESFDFDTLVGSRAIIVGRKFPRKFVEQSSITGEQLLAYEDIPDFAVNRYQIREGSLHIEHGLAVYIVTDGARRIKSSSGTTEIEKGDHFFLPALASEFELPNGTKIEIVEFLPLRVQDKKTQ